MQQIYLYAIFFCFAITLHNIEEAIWLPQWSQMGHSFQQPVTATEFHFAVLIITALAYFISFLFCAYPNVRFIKWAFTGFLGAMLVNAFFPHAIITVLTRSYAPGLLTGLLLNLPINGVILYFLLKQHFITRKEIILSTLSVGFLLVMLISILFRLAGHVMHL